MRVLELARLGQVLRHGRAAVAACACLMAGAPAAASLTVLERAAVAASADARFPTGAPTTSRQLPHDWHADPDKPAAPLWYRFDLDAVRPAAGGAPAAVLIERACGEVTLQVNGQDVELQPAPLLQPGRLCYHPLMATLPATALRSEGNVMDLRLSGALRPRLGSALRAAGLAGVSVGAQDDVAARYRAQLASSVVLPLVLGGVLVALAALAFVVGLANRRYRFWPYFAGLCAAWSVMMAGNWWPYLPVNAHAAEVVVLGAGAVALMCTALTLFRYALWQHRVVDAVLWAQCVLAPLSAWLAGPDQMFRVASAWYALLAAELVLAIGWYLWLSWRFARREFWFTAVVTLLAVVVLGWHFAGQQDGQTWVQRLVWQLGMPALLMLLGGRLFYQLNAALLAADGVRATLEVRAREAAAEMERSFAQMAEMRVEQVTQAERKRIAADLHDDLGAKLLTIVHTSDNERISTLAREALEEMRLSVRGLTGKPVQLADALGDWRAEVMARLSQAGLEGEWRAPTEELTQTLPARTYVQTTRILREAVSNIIKHSGASQCKVRCRLLDKDFQLIIQDNGRGISMELDGRLDRGHGMASMKHRAKQMHGQCLVESGPGFGTVIRLTLPL
jgi:signal transduction histidine kinase